MAKVFIEETTLTNIGDAIREKTGKTDLLAPGEMPDEIRGIQTGGGDIEVGPTVLTGNCDRACSGTLAENFMSLFINTISTSGITSMDELFYNSKKIDNIPFDINVSNNCKVMESVFSGCENLKAVPLIKGDLSAPTGNYSGVLDLDYLFYHCKNLREIPYDYFYNFGSEAFWEASNNYYGGRSAMFNGCHSLRRLPDLSMLSTSESYYGTLYHNGFSSCYALDEIVNLPAQIKATYTTNMFSNAFVSLGRVKNITFTVQEDGTPYVVKMKNQAIDLMNVGNTGWVSEIVDYNSGITADKEVVDDATYQALKDDPDWFTTKRPYSRYNHDSAVATINSLPDTSAYLAESGGTNTIKFRGEAGSATDGGAINTLTEAEIAVAAAKGWTVTLV